MSFQQYEPPSKRYLYVRSLSVFDMAVNEMHPRPPQAWKGDFWRHRVERYLKRIAQGCHIVFRAHNVTVHA
jgi:hypothetical protein